MCKYESTACMYLSLIRYTFLSFLSYRYMCLQQLLKTILCHLLRNLVTLRTGMVCNSQYFCLVLWQLGVPSVMPPVSCLSLLCMYCAYSYIRGILDTIRVVLKTVSVFDLPQVMQGAGRLETVPPEDLPEILPEVQQIGDQRILTQLFILHPLVL